MTDDEHLHLIAEDLAVADLGKLNQSALLRLLNSTPLGTVLTRSRLRRQMEAAGGRIEATDAPGRIHLLRYMRWLAGELDVRAAGGEHQSYGEAKQRQAARNRERTRAAQNIAPIPEIADWDRREACRYDLRKYLETYHADEFDLEWSKDHLRAIDRLQTAILREGLFAFAMPRGTGKTSLCRRAAEWAILYGHRPYVLLVAGTETKGKQQLMRPVRMALLENPLLLADFPEAVYPLRRLDNSGRQQAQQHCGGRLTHVRWADDEIVFPWLAAADLPAALREHGCERAPSAGGIIRSTSLDADLRGAAHGRPDGTTIRPTLAILDDPQTRQSAKSAGQTRYRKQLLLGDVLGMAGPGEDITAIMPCTVIYEGDLSDQMLDQQKHPDWRGERTKLVYEWPSNTKLWEKYAEIRADGLRRGEGLKPGTEFYRKHRKEMDAGAIVAWAEYYNRDSELSALQHAWNLRLKMGDEAFFAECQNEPMREQQSDERLTPQDVMERVNGRKRGHVPQACTVVTAHVDVHHRLLFWCVSAWQEDFTGYVVDYGTFPSQSRSWFAMRNCPITLRKKFPGRGVEGAMQAGLEQLVLWLLSKEWPRPGGAMRISRLLVDAAYKPEIVAAVKHRVGGETMTLSRGLPISAARKPISEYQRKPGERYGRDWYVPNVRKTREFPYLGFDANSWKSFAHDRLATPPGDTASLTLFGRKGEEHELFAEHVAASEYWVETSGRGRTVREWREKPSKPDNHWLDNLAGCAVAASFQGLRAPGEPAGERSGPRKLTQADLDRRYGRRS